MKGALVILVFLIIVGFILWSLDKRTAKTTPPTLDKEEAAPASEETSRTSETPNETLNDRPNASQSECCGQHLICEKTSLTPLSTEIEYFDDEELDRFAGKDPATYTPAEVEEMRDILLTMRPDEVPAWARSLQLRHIDLPPELREELLLIASEIRFHK